MRSLIDNLTARYHAWKVERERRKFEAAIDAAIDRALARWARSSTEAYHKHLEQKYGVVIK